jgi:K+-transporting ATPase c subunit
MQSKISPALLVILLVVVVAGAIYFLFVRGAGENDARAVPQTVKAQEVPGNVKLPYGGGGQ